MAWVKKAKRDILDRIMEALPTDELPKLMHELVGEKVLYEGKEYEVSGIYNTWEGTVTLSSKTESIDGIWVGELELAGSRKKGSMEKKAEKMQYVITFSYSFVVDAKDQEEAEALGRAKWDEIAPRTDEMNVDVDENGPASIEAEKKEVGKKEAAGEDLAVVLLDTDLMAANFENEDQYAKYLEGEFDVYDLEEIKDYSPMQPDPIVVKQEDVQKIEQAHEGFLKLVYSLEVSPKE